MADASTIARPYAKAVFDIARRDQALAGWSAALGAAARILQDDGARVFLARPDLDDATRVEFVTAVCTEAGGAELLRSGHGGNLLRLLAENDRLFVLPEISVQFDALKAQAENTVRVRLITATAVEESIAGRIGRSLESRLGRSVELELETDPGLLGGAVIRAEDMVIDGSVKSRLQKLAETLLA